MHFRISKRKHSNLIQFPVTIFSTFKALSMQFANATKSQPCFCQRLNSYLVYGKRILYVMSRESFDSKRQAHIKHIVRFVLKETCGLPRGISLMCLPFLLCYCNAHYIFIRSSRNTVIISLGKGKQ